MASQVSGACWKGSQPVSAVTTGNSPRCPSSAWNARKIAFVRSCGQMTFCSGLDGKTGAVCPAPATPTGTTSSISTCLHSPCANKRTMYLPCGL